MAGVAIDIVDRVRVRALPALEQESNGYRLVRGDTTFEMMGRDPAWLADVVDQLVNGWRCPLPTAGPCPSARRWRTGGARPRSLFGQADLEYMDIPAGPAARLSFPVGDPANPGFGQP